MCEFLESCEAPNAFWVQSIPTTHNISCCRRHLTMAVLSIEEASHSTGTNGAYARTYSFNKNGEQKWHTIDPKKHYGNMFANYARVTVKPHQPL